MQTPPLQCSPLGHLSPQPWQFPALRCVLTHWGGVPHGVSPIPQPQWPELQIIPPVHTIPQPPQLLPSVLRFTQALAQLCRPVPQLAWHVPPEHASELQAVPHAPQLFGS
jgi:hypothetical protein